MKKRTQADLLALQHRMDALRSAFATDPDAQPARLALQGAIRELIEGGILAGALTAGMRAPDIALPDTTGKRVMLSKLLQRGPVVVVFYRGDWCPYCRIDLQGLNAVRDEVSARHAALVAISPQTITANRRTRRELGLRYSLLSDTAGAAMTAFRLSWSMPALLHLGQMADPGGGLLPMAARYVIDRDGVIAYAEVNADPRFRGDLAALIPVLDILRDKKP